MKFTDKFLDWMGLAKGILTTGYLEISPIVVLKITKGLLM